ncbi:MAG: hypothetical protein WA047_05255 [Phenylobacterium sp.]|uniref:hypothetical protein n=1 Tax=Phenylobacterium sp. TaxID=1871053 RepID=UPI003BB4C42B
MSDLLHAGRPGAVLLKNEGGRGCWLGEVLQGVEAGQHPAESQGGDDGDQTDQPQSGGGT